MSNKELYDLENPEANEILVFNKSDVVATGVSTVINNWVASSPAVYVLKEWEKEYARAQNQMFRSLFNKSQAWPKLLWNTYLYDGQAVCRDTALEGSEEVEAFDPSNELGQFISRNLLARMAPFQFDPESITGGESTPTSSEMLEVLQGERFIEDKYISGQPPTTGDIFKIEDDYKINIRAACDTARVQNPVLHLLPGLEMVIENNNRLDSNGYKNKKNESVIPYLVGGKTIQFSFVDLETANSDGIIDRRLGRLLEPFLSEFLERYFSYANRTPLPPTPIKKIRAIVKEEEAAHEASLPP